MSNTLTSATASVTAGGGACFSLSYILIQNTMEILFEKTIQLDSHRIQTLFVIEFHHSEYNAGLMSLTKVQWDYNPSDKEKSQRFDWYISDYSAYTDNNHSVEEIMDAFIHDKEIEPDVYFEHP